MQQISEGTDNIVADREGNKANWAGEGDLIGT